MTVYVDTMRAPFRGMIMCHMTADSDEELIAFALKLGLKREWHQYPGTWKSHFDIALSKRKKAVKLGAKEISQRESVIQGRDRFQHKEFYEQMKKEKEKK
jgi:hypothetical protein